MRELPVRWYDSKKTIILLEITRMWTWDDANQWVKAVRQMTQSVNHQVYVVFHFATDAAAVMPKSCSVFPNLKYMMQSTLPQQNMILMVNSNKLMRGFMNILSTAYDLKVLFNRYHFVDTLEQALEKVEHVKAIEQITLDEEATLNFSRAIL